MGAFVEADDVPMSLVQEWSHMFSGFMDKYSTNVLQASEVQAVMDNRKGTMWYYPLENTDTLAALQSNMEKLLSMRVQQITNIARKVEDLFRNKVDRTLHPLHLNETFSQNEFIDPSVQKQYFAFNDANTIITSSAGWPTPEPVRLHPWYVQSVSGPKNIIIAIDTSLSMSANGRLLQAIGAAKQIIQGLSRQDSFNVMTFLNTPENDPAQNEHMNICWGQDLARASETNKRTITEQLENITPTSVTYTVSTVSAAFWLLSSSPAVSSTSENIVILLTDGMSGDTPLNKPVSPTRPSVPVRVLSYTFGPDIEHATVQSISCEYDGIFINVGNDADPIDRIATHYYEYLSLALSRGNMQPAWVGPREDMISLGLPAYDRTTDPPKLLGVAGIDLLLSEINAIALTNYKPGLQYSFVITNEGDTLSHPSRPYGLPTTLDIKEYEPAVRYSPTLDPRCDFVNTDFEAAFEGSNVAGQPLDVCTPGAVEGWSMRTDMINGKTGLAVLELGTPANATAAGASMILFHRFFHSISSYLPNEPELQKAVFRYGPVKIASLGVPMSVAVVTLSPHGYFRWADGESGNNISKVIASMPSVQLTPISFNNPHDFVFNSVPASSKEIRAGVLDDVYMSMNLTNPTSFHVAGGSFHVFKRFVATQRGVFRLWTRDRIPGLDMLSSRGWYTQAVRYGASLGMTAEVQMDSRGRRFVSISKALLEGSPALQDTYPAGVVSTAVTYTSFQRTFLNFTSCVGTTQPCVPCSNDFSTGIHCFLVNANGLIVTHALIPSAANVQMTLSIEEPGLASVLTSMGVLLSGDIVNITKFGCKMGSSCPSFTAKRDDPDPDPDPDPVTPYHTGTVFSYENLVVIEGVVSPMFHRCTTTGPFYMSNVPGTDLFLVVFHGTTVTPKICVLPSDDVEPVDLCESSPSRLPRGAPPMRRGPVSFQELERIRTYTCYIDNTSILMGILVPCGFVLICVAAVLICRFRRRRHHDRMQALQLDELSGRAPSGAPGSSAPSYMVRPSSVNNIEAGEGGVPSESPFPRSVDRSTEVELSVISPRDVFSAPTSPSPLLDPAMLSPPSSSYPPQGQMYIQQEHNSPHG